MIDEKIQEKVDEENRELAYFSFGCQAIGFITFLGIIYGIGSCQSKSELQNQYQNCQYFLDRATGDESKKFVYDDIIAVSGKYKGKTCREIIDLYQQRK